MDKFKPKSGIVVGIAALIVSYAYFVQSRAYLEGAMIGTASSGLYTQLLAYCMALCAGVLILRTYLRARKGKTEKRKEPLNYARFVMIVLLAAVFVHFLEFLGYILASVLMGAILLYVMTERNPVRLILFPTAYALVIYGLFVKVLLISLPEPWFMF